MNRIRGCFVILLLIVGFTPSAFAGSTVREFVVLYGEGVSLDAARQAIKASGGKLVKENAAVGVATVTTTNPNFVSAVRGKPALAGVAENRAIGNTPELARPKRDDVEREGFDNQSGQSLSTPSSADAAAEPLASLQWDMEMIHATVDGSYARQPGDKRVLVGIIDSGIDGSHPDLAPNFSQSLSRNFATDIPAIDGPCEVASCVDPAWADDNGHGTHVAGTVGAALNGLGIAGVAPNVTLVNVRGGQDSGYLFLQPVVDALVYSGDIGIDVVNMSFYIDPWLYNCTNNPADSPERQLEQRTVIAATNRALDYAFKRGVTLVSSAGNGHTDLGNPSTDSSSPDYPPGSAYPRTIDNSTCLVMPTEGNNVISVSAVGPSKAKADYSNYGVEQVSVAAPGGYFRDFLGTPMYRQNSNQILSTYPKSVLEANGLLAPDGTPLTSAVIRDCQDGTCAYYAYLQGTSMASPHAAGVAALIVSKYGNKDGKRPGGLTLNPVQTGQILQLKATEHACPEPRLVDYTNVGRSPDFNALCEGDLAFNGFYGYGIVDALNAVSGTRDSQ